MRRIDELSPDGVLIVVQWDVMGVGSSAFIPCIDTVTAKKQIAKALERRGWEYKVATHVENKTLGVRIWRIL